MKQPISMMIISVLALAGCREITRSVDETFHPKDTIVNHQNKGDGTSGEPAGITKTTSSSTITVETHTATHTEADTDQKIGEFLTDTKALQQAEAALKALPQYAGKEIFVYSYIYFRSNGNISLILRHPTELKYLDRYEYSNGKWSAPTPVQLSIKDNIETRLVSLRKISFATTAKVAKIYNEKAAGIEGAKPTAEVYIYLSDQQINWTPAMHNFLNGSRGRYSIKFNADGTLKSFKQE